MIDKHKTMRGWGIGGKLNQPYVESLRHFYDLDKKKAVPDKMRCWFKRCVKNHKAMVAAGGTVDDFVARGRDGRKRKRVAEAQVPA